MEKGICTFLFVLELVGPVYADEVKMNCKLSGDKFGKTVHFKYNDNFLISDKAYARLDGKEWEYKSLTPTT